jgi:hypothetical protein
VLRPYRPGVGSFTAILHLPIFSDTKNLSLNRQREPSDKKGGGEYETEKVMGDNRCLLEKGGTVTAAENTGSEQGIPAETRRGTAWDGTPQGT